MVNRRVSRILALQGLYAWEIGGMESLVPTIEGAVAEAQDGSEGSEYAIKLCHKAIGAQATIDELISKYAVNWDLKRMASIDRSLLRVALAELIFFKNVPFKVVIDESVEIAKLYGTDDSAKFVNGILDAVYKEISTPEFLSKFTGETEA